MDKIWLKSYPPGVPAEIDLNEYASINEVVAQSCRKYRDLPAFVNFGTTLTYAGLDRLSRNFGAWLQSLGLAKGARVALMMPNLLQYPVALFGVLRGGFIAVNVNPLYTARELEHQLKDSGAEVIVILENFAHVLEKALPNTAIRHVVTTQVGDLLAPSRRFAMNFAIRHIKKMVPEWHIGATVGLRTALARGARAPFHEASPTHADIAVLQYTGGTTGKSKGAMLTHGGLVANLLQACAWSTGLLEEGRETVVTALPLYHVFSFTFNCLLFITIGGVNLLITNPKDLPGFVKELRQTRWSVMSGVNTLFNALLNTPGFDTLDFSRVKFAMGGGAAVHRTVGERWQRVTGHPLLQGYGLTETSPFVSCNPFNAGYSPTIGLPLPSTDVAILDDAGQELPIGAEGEICVKGPQVMAGYWQLPGETTASFTAEGWLRTGDIGIMDETGCLRITDRKKDMILVSGFNVYPNEIENVIAGVPGVVECGVVGVPDVITGEVVKAFVVRDDPGLSAEEIVRLCRQSLTNYKVPRMIEFRDSLPKTPVGKILRRELRAEARSGESNLIAQVGRM
ncbi:MAG TPA: AMP-binding protein [Bryobacteraceae bacterium]|nr:AMP-binding protein [Bryobacteraceae bacterium]